ncbi:NAD(P)/FAD-dependent oxidoreductase [Arenibacter sp. F20364]|uniref:phytoene desaturase family protein n=1 Tax=Arenibacter sp. F20364 TaxID=2926415 RepID=UPI001FF1C745|nr:NAD(P)/FAD-dependent oxidoreductase [Arenibacter sp. F20364]MCK0189282.1 NAD(P)/FAD-dependent oxidoreductase [Arenibacter sp. F20364]
MDIKNKVHQNIDTIIIGSGAGGLSAAICLSKAGHRVLVLEQHDVPGGWCHSFYLNGHRFSPGVHYIGLLGEGESTRVLYEGLGIANDLVFFRMNPEGYEHCFIGEDRIDLPGNFNDLNTSLAKRFPKEKKRIYHYLKLVRNVSRQIQLIPKINGFWDHITIPYRTKHMGKYAMFSLKRVINWHIKDPLLQKVLNIQWGDHGLAPARASFPLHCAVMGHYFSGGYYPMGGGAAIVKAMTKALQKNGGTIRTGTAVKSILLEGDKKKKAIGVELENGEKIFASRIISNADPGITYLNLVKAQNLSAKLLKKLNKTKYSCSSLMLFLTVDADVRKLGMDSGNIWMMDNRDMDGIYEEMTAVDISIGKVFPGLFVSCTTLKDPTSYDGKYHSLEVITYINPDSFSKFNKESNLRSKEYMEFKELLTCKMINTLERALPGIKDKIIHKELGTPITNKHYVNTTNGNVYGTEKTFRQIGPFAFRAKSEIENLFMCGASIQSHGVAGASYSGVQTAAAILNCRQDDLIKPNELQNIRIFEAEDDSDYPTDIQQKIKVRKARLLSNEKKHDD